jgi:diguanylate cyclase (GGDEF)-like protein
MGERLGAPSPQANAIGLGLLAASAPECVHLDLGVDFHVRAASLSLAEMLGRPPHALVGLAAPEVLAATSLDWVMSVRQGGSRWHGPALLHLLDAAGHPFTVRAVARSRAAVVTVLGVATATHEFRLRDELVQLNNELAVVSRELARERHRLQQVLDESEARNRALQAANAQIARLARIDPLTGLTNRRVLTETLPREVERARRGGHSLAVVMIDLDHFKRVNDRWGHDAGDRLLVSVGGLLIARLRQTDLAVRLGGEEFALLLPETNAAQAASLAEELRQRLTQAADHGLPEPQTASLGVAVWSPTDIGPDDLLRRADRALYTAKKLGRNRVEVAI